MDDYVKIEKIGEGEKTIYFSVYLSTEKYPASCRELVIMSFPMKVYHSSATNNQINIWNPKYNKVNK